MFSSVTPKTALKRQSWTTVSSARSVTLYTTLSLLYDKNTNYPPPLPFHEENSYAVFIKAFNCPSVRSHLTPLCWQSFTSFIPHVAGGLYSARPIHVRLLMILGTLRIYDGDGEDDAQQKMCFYVSLKLSIYWDLSSVSVGIKTCLSWICYEYVQFQKELRKISGCGSRSPDNT